MKRITFESKRYQKWIESIEDLFSAAFVIKYDEDLTLLAANEIFYTTLGFSRKHVKMKYGDRLATLFNERPFKHVKTLKNGETSEVIRCKQNISIEQKLLCLDVTILAQGTNEGVILCCIAIDITEYEKCKNELSTFAETVLLGSKQAGVGYVEYDIDTKEAIAYTNNHSFLDVLELKGSVIPDFLNQLVTKGIVSKEDEKVLKDTLFLLEKREEKSVCELQVINSNKEKVWIRASVIKKQNENKFVVIFENITQERKTMQTYLNETQFFQAMLREKDAFAEIDVNSDKITRIGGMWNLYNEIIHKIKYSDLIIEFINKVVHPEDRKHYLEVMQTSNFIESYENGIDQVGCQFRRIVDQNKMMWMELHVFLFRNPLTQNVHALLTIKNIDEKKKQEMLLLHSSHYDQLTNLYNKKASEEFIIEYLMSMKEGEQCAFIVLHLDNLKHINDSQGHKLGDQILLQFSTILSEIFAEKSIISRFGGDEFIVLIRDIKDVAEVKTKMKELYSANQQLTSQCEFFCSAGISIANQDMDYDQVFQQADYSLYQAKSLGNNQCVVYTEIDNCMYQKIKANKEKNGVYHKMLTKEEFMSKQRKRVKDVPSIDSFLGEHGEIAYIVDIDTFELISGNKAFYDRIGLSPAQCGKRKCYELMHKRNSPCPFCSKANWSIDKFYLWRNYNKVFEQEFLIKNRLITWENEEAMLAIAIDLSNDKSIVDSIDSEEHETHSILSGVQQMNEAQSLEESMEKAMEIIASFFRADTVRFWQFKQEEKAYQVSYLYTSNPQKNLSELDINTINAWLGGRNIEHPLTLESPEAMLGYSYEMFQFMKQNDIKNQKWIQIKDKNKAIGYIAVENISRNFQNVSFLESFILFISNELRMRGLMEDALYSEKYDSLTGLLSRKSYENYMSTYNPDDVSSVCVFLANFDNLKGINSSRGFQTGNYYIRQFSKILKEEFNQESTYRLNGDEFLVIIPNVSNADVMKYTQALQSAVKEIGSFNVSIGTAWDDVEKDISVLIEQATQALNVLKKKHSGGKQISGDEQHRKMLGELMNALENNEFEAFLQPKVDLKSGELMGAEALIRYYLKDHGYVPPAMFIETLEKNNLIRYIDLFVFEEVCKILETWKKEGRKLPIISLNFSRLTLLERDLLETVEFIISKYDVSKEHIEIEVTESIASMGKTAVYQVAKDLYKEGYAIALDDFGTKYTNLAILSELDFTVLKIDRSLVGELENREKLSLILKNVINMCNDIGISVIAEGIETEKQEEILKQLGCTYGQGYLYGAPMPISDFKEKFILK